MNNLEQLLFIIDTSICINEHVNLLQSLMIRFPKIDVSIKLSQVVSVVFQEISRRGAEEFWLLLGEGVVVVFLIAGDVLDDVEERRELHGFTLDDAFGFEDDETL